jgi:predicted enzyme related to lactoylglutathione lyase
MANAICHFEFMSNDPARSKKFYGSIFDWTFDDQGMPGYTMVKTGADPGGGIFEKPKEAPAPALNVYVLVENIEETLGKAKAAGGHVIKDRTPIPETGAWAMFSDPDGICVGIFEPLKR